MLALGTSSGGRGGGGGGPRAEAKMALMSAVESSSGEARPRRSRWLGSRMEEGAEEEAEDRGEETDGGSASHCPIDPV